MNPMNENARKYLTVSEINEYSRMLLESDDFLSSVAVRGEISNFRPNYSGHLYFTLKDGQSAIRCVMFASAAQHLAFSPADGTDVIAYGRITIYPRDGTFQLNISAMTDAGIGNKYAAFERLKKKLAAEGLFDAFRKKPIPKFPERIGVVTSATGAAVQDFLNITGRRYPLADILLYPAQVQGTGAAASVAEGILYFQKKQNVDVIVIGRGGGSFEDLDAFNDETLARVIAACDIPLISAVGHETDYTISDFVADLRAPTPSAAAELSVPDAAELKTAIASYLHRMQETLGKQLSVQETRVQALAASSVLASPERALDVYENTVLSDEVRLHSAFDLLLTQKEAGIPTLRTRLNTAMDQAVRRNEASVPFLSHRLQTAAEKQLSLSESRFSGLGVRLDAISPLKVLNRGYSMVTEKGKTITSAEQLSVNDRITVRFAQGSADATVTEVKK